MALKYASNYASQIPMQHTKKFKKPSTALLRPHVVPESQFTKYLCIFVKLRRFRLTCSTSFLRIALTLAFMLSLAVMTRGSKGLPWPGTKTAELPSFTAVGPLCVSG